MPHKALARVSARGGSFAALVFAFALFPSLASAVDGGPTPDPTPGSTDAVVLTGTGAAFVTIFANSVISDFTLSVTDSVNSTRISNALAGNQGIVQVNQDAGVGANQANIVSISAAAGAGTVPVGVTILSEARYSNNTIFVSNVTRTSVIENILDGSTGIAQINQNSGNLNRNLNALGIAIGFGKGDAVVITDGNLAAATSGATYNVEGAYNASSSISGVRNFSGIGQIAQTAGDGNVAVNSLAIGVTVINK